MNIKDAIEMYEEHQRTTLKSRTRESYKLLLEKYREWFRDREAASVKAEEIFQFLESSTGRSAKSTRHLRYAQMKAFFNFALRVSGSNIQNPCNSSRVSKAFQGCAAPAPEDSR